MNIATRLLASLLFCICCLPLSGCLVSQRYPDSNWQPPPIKVMPETERYYNGSMAYVPFRERKLIVIDPGHGGKDLGTHSSNSPKYQEKQMTLATARLLKQHLEQLGYAVVLTRTEDIFISLDARAEFANNQKPEVFVSMHYNSAPNKEAQGIEVFYYRSDKERKRTNDSKALGKSILNHLINVTEAKSRGLKHGNLAVIRQTNMPAVLVEGGFASNSEELQKLKDINYLRKIAKGVAQGIHDYISKGS